MTTESTLVPSEPQAGILVTEEELANLTWNNEVLNERLAQLELQLEDQGWTSLTGGSETEFSRDGLRRINTLARMMYLKNPLIHKDHIFIR